MIAILKTPNYEVSDFELVTHFRVRKGETFSIVVEDAALNSDWTSNADPTLMITPLSTEGNSGVKIVASGVGQSKLFIIGPDDKPLKKWLVEVYNDEATNFRVPAGRTEDLD